MASEAAIRAAQQIDNRVANHRSVPKAEIIDAAFSPVLAAKDAEIERLKGDLADSRHWQKRHCTESAANGVQSVEHWKKLQLVVSERDALAAQVAELKRDAERYRWLRRQNIISVWQQCGLTIDDGPDELDAAIDAALAK